MTVPVPEKAAFPAKPDDLFEVFETLEIPYTLYRHDPVFTVAESSVMNLDIPGTYCRNLFLKDKKKKMFLTVLANETQVRLKDMEALINSARLSFGSPERLWTYLGVKPGSVCPFAVMNDRNKEITVILDAFMMKSDLVGYHPLDNAMTLTLKPNDLMRFFKWTGHSPQIVDFS